MIAFAQTTKAPKPKTEVISIMALMYACILVVMAIAQLFAFEKMIPMIESFGLGGGEARATLYASIIVIAEVFALPFLLRMYLSPAMRIVSMVMGWIAAGMWLYSMIVLNVTLNSVGNVEVVGSTISTSLGRWGICYALCLVALTAWVSWGMWPIPAGKKHAVK